MNDWCLLCLYNTACGINCQVFAYKTFLWITCNLQTICYNKVSRWIIDYTVDTVGPNVLIVRVPGVTASWEQWLLLRSDAHHDSPRCDRTLERKHLDKALVRGALILDFGDCLDAMQGRFDPRRNYDDVRPEDAGIDYYDRIVDHAAEDYRPYRDNWLLWGQGNHETSVLAHTNHDLTTALRRAVGAGYKGGYGGWVKFMFEINGTKRTSLNLKYHHGAGGGGPVTRGVIQTNRQAVYLPDADIVVNGHTHDSWIVSVARERLNIQGRVIRDIVRFIRLPGYKDDYGDGSGGFHIERWGPPKPLGCCWIRLFCEDAQRSRIGIEAYEDIS